MKNEYFNLVFVFDVFVACTARGDARKILKRKRYTNERNDVGATTKTVH